MFSFFKKKPAPAPRRSPRSPHVATAARRRVRARPTPAERPRGKLDWLNADVGELFFGKKPVAARRRRQPTPAPPAPAGADADDGAPPPVAPSIRRTVATLPRDAALPTSRSRRSRRLDGQAQDRPAAHRRRDRRRLHRRRDRRRALRGSRGRAAAGRRRRRGDRLPARRPAGARDARRTCAIRRRRGACSPTASTTCCSRSSARS